MADYLADMEFVATVQGEIYKFSSLNKDSYLITGANREYILYKTKAWRCADEITARLLQSFGEILEEHLQMAH